MKARKIFASVLTAAVLAGGAFARGEDAKTGTPQEPAAPPEKAKALKNPEGWPVLKKGATAEEVLKLVGKPDQIRPMDTKEGKAEVWVYRRLARHVERQSAVTTQNVTMFTGSGTGNDAYAATAVPVFRTEHINVYQVSSLLMFEGQLVTATQKVETERKFDN